ncbi:MAG: SOS response-associated peptidase [Candidatus Eremiobacteraeota bacterium]|nr:SOS response-associated peptidase [Candidatus Eremiobacteraeota bacterium]
MCGRYGLTSFPASLLRRLGGRPNLDVAFRPRYNIAPTQPLLAVLNDDDRSIVDLRWGLVPSWAASPASMKLTTFNARIETIATAPAYADSLVRKRCAIPASGYFEWRKNADGSKTPLWIHRRDDEPFAFAGLWSTWRRGDDILRSCAIVTQPPDDFMRPIHSRMPVVLDESGFEGWLARGHREPADSLASLDSQRSKEWAAHAVSSRVGNVRNDDADLLEPHP